MVNRCGLRVAAIVAVISGIGTASADPSLTDERCTAAPVVRPEGFRHRRSKLIARLAPNHRGNDLLAARADATQQLAGKLAYGPTDKDLEDEIAEVFACERGAWRSLGRAATNGDGRFELVLGGASRLPAGIRDLFVAAVGDGTGAWFVGLVALPGTSVVVTDIDGTLSASENAIINQVVAGRDIAHRPDAPEALRATTHPIVYVTTRGDMWTGMTRAWLDRHGFPRGVLRLAGGLMVAPGRSSITFKTRVMRALTLPMIAGIGNRETDIVAYRNVGLAPTQIFIHLPEYESEVRAELAAGNATGVRDYAALRLP